MKPRQFCLGLFLEMNKSIDKKLVIILVGVLVLCGTIAIAKFYIIPKMNPNILGVENKQLAASDQSDFSLNSSSYKSDDITVISNFEKNEDVAWQGNGVLDEKIYYEGVRSMGLISVDRKAASITLEKVLDLTNMKQIEFMLHVTDAEAYETVIIDFGDLELKNYYRYTLSNLRNGWNLIRIPKEKFIPAKVKDSTFDWPNIEKVRFYSLSRPASIFLTRLDMLRSINYPDSFLTGWRANLPETLLSLYERFGTMKLMARSIGGSVATIKNIEDINNFDYSASVSPQTVGRVGLFVRGDYLKGNGYYFLLGGEKKNTWFIIKKNIKGWTPTADIVQGSLDNVVFAKDKDYWLRVKGKGNLMEFYFSFDGQQYEKLGELNDDEFRGGGVGIAVLDGNWSLFDNFQFIKN